jgi:hypothetical protein
VRLWRWFRMWVDRVVFLIRERDGWNDDDRDEWRQ